MRPMLATRGDHVPGGGAWLHEVKWDGMRVLVEATGDGSLRIWSRNEKDVTVSFPELHGLGRLARDVLLDGEVVAFADGVPAFAALTDRMHVASARRAEQLSRTTPVTLLVFDVLRLDGEDLTGRALTDRRVVLEGLGLADVHWQVPAAYDDGAALLTATAQQGLEGVVSKRRSSRYLPGRRSPDWLKFPHRAQASYVVGGWRREGDSVSRLGAVLVGEPTAEGLHYRGRVGSGIAGKEGRRLLERLAPLREETSPFATDVPAVDARGTTWVRPVVVVDVAALGTTPAGRLRQPSYRGVRGDLSAVDLLQPATGAEAPDA
ncbi:MAG: non-homologous end-joining DNA ligase [Nocardioidaceae bacterium]